MQNLNKKMFAVNNIRHSFILDMTMDHIILYFMQTPSTFKLINHTCNLYTYIYGTTDWLKIIRSFSFALYLRIYTLRIFNGSE